MSETNPVMKKVILYYSWDEGGGGSHFRIRVAFLYKITMDISYLGKQVHITTQHLTTRRTRAVHYHVTRGEREGERERERAPPTDVISEAVHTCLKTLPGDILELYFPYQPPPLR